MRASTALGRGAAFFGLWVLLSRSAHPADVAVGLLAAAGATAVSVLLAPSDYGRLHARRLLAALPPVLWQSVLAGIDVACRALHPRMPLRPGFVAHRTALPRGLARNTFATITSLVPGTLAADEVDGVLIYHCLEVEATSVPQQLAAQERELGQALEHPVE